MIVYRLLVVEDDPLVRKVLFRVLTDGGYECLEASSISAALESCEAVKPDLILMDVKLPDGDGIAACRMIKDTPRLKDIPVVIVTGEAAGVEHRVAGLDAGAEDYILKPFLPQELVSRVKGILRLRRRA